MKTTLAMMALLGTALASDVVVGTADNFDSLVQEGVVLVKFYAPWCGHCKQMVPEWEKAATELKGKATLVKVDATVEEDLGTKYEVQGFPTIKAFIGGGDAIAYDGGRTAPDFVAWVSKMSGPAVQTIADAAALKELREAENVVAVAFFASEDSDDAKAYAKLAAANRAKFVFGAVYSADLAASEGASVPGLVVYKKFDNGKDVMSPYAVDEVLAFVTAASFPLLGKIGPENYQGYVERDLAMGWLFLEDDADEVNEAAKKAVTEACKPVAEKVSCVYLSGTQYGQMAERIGLSGKKFPSFGIDDKSEHFPFDESAELTAEALTAYLADFSAGKLVATVKSQAVPEEHTVEGLTTLVGDSIMELAFDEGKNVLIKFYAPWCGHCKQMAPDYAKLAKHFEDDAEVMIADFDATENDAPKDFKVEGFPTLYFKKKGSSTPELYDGGRDFDGMKTAIEEKRA